MSPVSDPVELIVYPSNNLWIDALPITGESGTFPGSLISSDVETGENALARRLNTYFSVWYKWTPPFSGTYYFEVDPWDDNTDFVLDIVRDSTDAATGVVVAVSENRSHTDFSPRATLNAVQDTDYWIRVSLYDTATPPDEPAFYLKWGPTAVPDNCVPTGAVDLRDIELSGTTYDGLSEDGYPTAWYTYTNRTMSNVLLSVDVNAIDPDANSFLISLWNSDLALLEGATPAIPANYIDMPVLPGERFYLSVTDLADDGSMGAFGLVIGVVYDSNPLCDVEGWWNCAYTYRKAIDVTAPVKGLALTDSITTTLLKTDSLEQGKIRTDLQDIEVIYSVDDVYFILEKDVVETEESIEITFPPYVALTASSVSSGDYHVYYGNPDLIQTPVHAEYIEPLWPFVSSLDSDVTYTMPGMDWTQASSNRVGAKAVMSFYGKAVRIRANKTLRSGIIEVQIDETPPVMVDLYSVTSQSNVEVFSAQDLTGGLHTIRIKVSNEKNPSSTDHYVQLVGLDIVKWIDVVNELEEIIPLRWTSGMGSRH